MRLCAGRARRGVCGVSPEQTRCARQVNDTSTTDHDCCHIVPLIASVGDRLELVVARNPLSEQNPQLEVSLPLAADTSDAPRGGAAGGDVLGLRNTAIELRWKQCPSWRKGSNSVPIWKGAAGFAIVGRMVQTAPPCGSAAHAMSLKRCLEMSTIGEKVNVSSFVSLNG